MNTTTRNCGDFAVVTVCRYVEHVLMNLVGFVGPMTSNNISTVTYFKVTLDAIQRVDSMAYDFKDDTHEWGLIQSLYSPCLLDECSY